MIETLKGFRRKIAAHDITFWEALPAILALIIPSIFDPEWLSRLLAFFIAGATLLFVCGHALLIPEQFQFPNVRNPQNRKYFFWSAYLGVIVAVPIVLFYFLIPSSTDLYRVLQYGSSTALQQKQVDVVQWGGGGSVAPFFVGQRLQSSDGKIYFLPFSFRAWGSGTVDIIFSPATDIIYEIRDVPPPQSSTTK
jgi:hypothetical protein